MAHFCLDCSTAIKGRADKKFCDYQCRNNYNNRLKAADLSFVNSVNQILKKNRKILKAQNPFAKIKVKRDLLLSKGFNFNFNTHSYITKKGNIYLFCYEYGYLALGNEELLLVKKETK